MYHTLIHARGASHLWLIYMNAFNIDHHLCCQGNVVRGYLYKIPEWVSLQSEVRTAFNMIKSNGSAEGILLAWFSCQIRYACATHPRLLKWTLFRFENYFQTGIRFIFSLQDTKTVSEWQFHRDWKPGWTHSGLTFMGTTCHFGIMYM